MRGRPNENLWFFAAVAAAVTLTVAVIICALAFGNDTLEFKSAFYFVCYARRDDSYSAAAMSETVSNYGGAGYALEYGGEYYATVACYYSERDANTVRASLMRRGLDCFVLEAETEEYPLPPSARGQRELYAGNFKTLYSLSELCYNCANGLDTGGIGQNAAKSVLVDIKNSINGLQNANSDNCFTPELKRLYSECETAESGYIYSKTMRKIQIAIADAIINMELF